MQCSGLTGPQDALRDIYQVGKDRENTFESKASASEPHTAPAEHLERTQFLAWYLRYFSHLSLQKSTGCNWGYCFTISAIKVVVRKAD